MTETQLSKAAKHILYQAIHLEYNIRREHNTGHDGNISLLIAARKDLTSAFVMLGYEEVILREWLHANPWGNPESIQDYLASLSKPQSQLDQLCDIMGIETEGLSEADKRAYLILKLKLQEEE